MLKQHKRKLKLKQFPYDFNEADLIIHDFAKLYKERRHSVSEDRRSSSETTDVSGNLSDRNLYQNSDGNLSDCGGDGHIHNPSQFKNYRPYDPLRDCEESKRGRTKQKVYVKYAQQKLRKYSIDSSASEESGEFKIMLHHFRLR